MRGFALIATFIFGSTLCSGCLFLGDTDPDNNGGTINNGSTNNGTIPNLCNNGVLNPGEECDTVTIPVTCDDLIIGSDGDLTCSQTCTIDRSACVVAEKCGNGILDTELNEECDTDLPLDLGCDSDPDFLPGGAISCDSDCKFDTSMCQAIECGDGIVSVGEECEVGEPSETCETLGLGEQYPGTSPRCNTECQFVQSDCDVRTLSSASAAICVLAENFPEPVSCWGLNLGVNSGLSGAIAPPNERTKFTQISVGGRHVCGVKVDGTVRCWGRNANEESGVGAFLYTIENGKFVPTRDNSDFTQVSAGPLHISCGLKAGGNVECWGTNKVDVPGSAHKYVAAGFQRYDNGAGQILNGGRACVLNSNDFINCFSTSGSISPVNRYKQFALSPSKDCGIRFNNELFCWEPNSLVLTPPPAPINNNGFKQVSVSGTDEMRTTVVCGLKEDGRARCWSDFASPVVDNAPANVEFSQIGIGEAFGCGLRIDDGKIQCWGTNSRTVLSGNPDFCGNGIKNFAEECDTTQTRTCTDFGRQGDATPQCLNSCIYDRTMCGAPL